MSGEGGSPIYVYGILRLGEAVLINRLLEFQVVPHIVDYSAVFSKVLLFWDLLQVFMDKINTPIFMISHKCDGNTSDRVVSLAFTS